MKLYLVRHGQTKENSKAIMQGHMEGTLSDKGKEQAKKITERLKKHKFDAIYVSDLIRTRETAKEIISNNPKAKVFFVKELRERFMGKYQGMTKSQVNWDEFNSDPEVETWEDMLSRAKKFLHGMIHKHLNKEVLIVAHGGTNLALVSILTKRPRNELIKQQNTELSIFEVDEDFNHKIIIENSREHLGNVKVMCFGTFDLLHVGHLDYFRQAKEHGDVLTVVIARDVTKEKESKKIVSCEHDRCELVSSLEIVDEAILGDSKDHFKVIVENQPNVIFLGYDHKINEDNLKKNIIQRGVDARIIRGKPYKQHEHKSSKIREKIRNL